MPDKREDHDNGRRCFEQSKAVTIQPVTTPRATQTCKDTTLFTMPQPSDSSFAAVTRHRKPFSTAGRPPAIDIIDDEWASDKLPDDDVDVQRHEAAVAPLLEEGELDADAIVVSPSGNSSAAANNASERRRREEGWTELGLDQLLDAGSVNPTTVAAPAPAPTTSNTSG